MITSPPDNLELPAIDGGNNVSIVISIEDAILGSSPDDVKVRFLLDGEVEGVQTAGVSFTFTGVEPGMHQIVAQLLDQSDEELPNAESFDVIHVKVYTACKVAADCVDEAVCSNHNCLSNECRYGPKEGCCDNAFDCTYGYFCVDNDCLECLDDGHCDDGSVCTIDSCGEDGACTHEWIDGCCETATHCDDGQFCTIDTCTLNTCSHEDSGDPACCNDVGDCTPPHPCMASMCYAQTTGPFAVQFCRYGPLMQGCCTDASECYDANPCTIDTCDKALGNTSDCCYPSVDTGCDDAACEATVCEEDSFCCDIEWDFTCVEEAFDLCDGTCELAQGTCCETGEGTGCGYLECEQEVCELDDFCCEEQWDELCAVEANVLCDACTGEGETGQCVHLDDESKPNCCLVDKQCDDDDPSTQDVCVEGECQSEDIEGYCALSGAPTLVINELHAYSHDDAVGEWLELFHAGDGIIDLTGWTITTSDDESFTMTAATATAGPSTMLALPGTYIALGKSAKKDDLGFIPHFGYGDAITLRDKWNDGVFTHTVSVRDPEGALVHSVTYDQTWPFAEKRSLEAIHPWADLTSPTHWRASGQSATPQNNLKYGKLQFGVPYYGSPRYFNKSSAAGIAHEACDPPEGGGPCDVNLCDIHSTCVESTLDGCCTEHADCADGDPCTESTCNTISQTCNAPTPVAECCNTDSECDNGSSCDIDRCLNHECRYSPNIVPGCCADDGDCDDHDDCTVDACDTEAEACLDPVPVLPEGGGTCCHGDADCGEAEACDDADNDCDSTACEVDADCADDANPCTTPVCGEGGICGFDTTPDCCAGAGDCPEDGDACTDATCIGNVCGQAPVAAEGCCNDATECDDLDDCTTDTCVLNTCHNTDIDGCCASADDCDDLDDCTSNECGDDDLCAYEHEIGCCHVGTTGYALDLECGVDSDGEGNCYAWTCDDGECVEETNPACCFDDADCEDTDDCTVDACVDNACKNTFVAGEGCCQTDADCASGETCADGVCNAAACVEPCPNYPARTVHAGGPGQDACQKYYTQAECDAAYHMTDPGHLAPCYWDGSDCFGCGPSNAIFYDCDPCSDLDIQCEDPTLTDFAGGPYAGACGYISDQATCDSSYHLGWAGVAPCVWDGSGCVGCGPENRESLGCTNTCATYECADETLTDFAGGPGMNACQSYGDQTSCEAAYHAGTLGVSPCYWDGSGCYGCGYNAGSGDCENTCVAGGEGPVCEQSPDRTEYGGGPGSAACAMFDDPESCLAGFHTTSEGTVASCAWFQDDCWGCGPGSGFQCDNECDLPYCFASGEGSCCEANGSPGCEDADAQLCVCDVLPYCCDTMWVEACVTVAAEICGDCPIPDPECSTNLDCAVNETCADGLCAAICSYDCPGDASRTTNAGGPGDNACSNIDDQAACEASYHTTSFGNVASCAWDGSFCYGCGYANAGSGCEDTCIGDLACSNPAYTEYTGGPYAGACQEFGEDPYACNAAFHTTEDGTLASCYWDGSGCFGCGPGNDGSSCSNQCVPECEGDPVRTVYVGGDGDNACSMVFTEFECGVSYHTTSSGTVASCYWDGSSCYGCGDGNDGDSCYNTCAVGSCAGGLPGDCCSETAAPGCSVPDVQSCVCELEPYCCDTYWAQYCVGLARDQCGAECTDECTGESDCADGAVCVDGTCLLACIADECGGRSNFAGGPLDEACSALGDETTCLDSYHQTGDGDLAPCHWDPSGWCFGCGPTNGEFCPEATCDGGQTIPLLSAIAGGTGGTGSVGGCIGLTNDAGGPGTSACYNIESQSLCEQSYHTTWDGSLASCYWTGSNCQGCGESNDGLTCDNTCIPDCPGDPARSLYLGGPSESACHAYDGSEAACEAAYHTTSDGEVASCWWDGSLCSGCGSGNFGACTNACPAESCPALVPQD